MGLFSRVATALEGAANGRILAQEYVNEGVKAMMARGGAPDRIRADMDAYRDEVDAAVQSDHIWTAEDFAALEYGR